jgi:hypothetical protein
MRGEGQNTHRDAEVVLSTKHRTALFGAEMRKLMLFCLSSGPEGAKAAVT